MGLLNDTKNFAVGTVKGIGSNGWGGLKAGLWTSGGLGLAVGIGAAMLGAWPILAVVGGLATFAGTLIPAASWGTAIGGGWGALTGGTKQVKAAAIEKGQNLEAELVTEQNRLQNVQQQNTNIRTAIAQQGTQQQRAAQYQMPNHLAEGNAPDKFQSQFAAAPGAAQGKGR